MHFGRKMLIVSPPGALSADESIIASDDCVGSADEGIITSDDRVGGIRGSIRMSNDCVGSVHDFAGRVASAPPIRTPSGFP
jgi:hypothetical protein